MKKRIPLWRVYYEAFIATRKTHFFCQKEYVEGNIDYIKRIISDDTCNEPELFGWSQNDYLEASGSKRIDVWAVPVFNIGFMCQFYKFFISKRKKNHYNLFYLFYSDCNAERIIANDAVLDGYIREMDSFICASNVEEWCRVLLEHYYKTSFYAFADHYYRSLFDSKNRRADNGVYYSLSKDEYLSKAKVLERIGLSDKEYICFCARDPEYCKRVGRLFFAGEEGHVFDESRDAASHIFRDSDARCYNLLAEKMKESSVLTVRMGKYQNEIKGLDQNIIDFTKQRESDFDDLAVFSDCMFFMTDTSGIQYIPKLFGKRIVFTNSAIYYVSQDISDKGELIMYRTIIDPEGNRVPLGRLCELANLVYENHRQEELATCVMSYMYENGYTTINNTSEDLLDAANEMMGIIKGTRVYTREEKKLISKHYSILKKHNRYNLAVHYAPICVAWAKKNMWFLED